MERNVINSLKDWKKSPKRKPLIITGVRQCGKTWVLEEFGKRCYKNTALFDFYQNPEYKQFFDTTKNPKRILENLSMASGHTIKPYETLIIFDEIQECGNALNSLKYFCDNAPEYHIACAGSLLGVLMSKIASFPVGKVNFINMYPMTFTEFLHASGDSNLAEYISRIEEISPIPDAFYNPLTEKLKMYFVTGGMPESVKEWTEEKNINAVQTVLSEIIGGYERDFSKHAELYDQPKINLIWQTLPSQLSRENKKFTYKTVKQGARAREYEDALQWLVDAGLVYKIYRTTAPRLPQRAYEDISAFKIYAVDVGLLRKMSMLAPTAFGEGNRLFTEFKGALTENYVVQSLKPLYEGNPSYWSVDNPRYEVDLLVQRDNDIFPIEIKADENIKSVSLKKYADNFPEQTKLRIRFSRRNLKQDDDLLNIPLFMADYTDNLINIALDKG